MRRDKEGILSLQFSSKSSAPCARVCVRERDRDKRSGAVRGRRRGGEREDSHERGFVSSFFVFISLKSRWASTSY